MKFLHNAKTTEELSAIDKINELYEIAQKKGLNLPSDVGCSLFIDFNLNSVRAAGIAEWKPRFKSMKIRLHRKALGEFGESFINGTVVHEFAHILQYCNDSYRSKPHGYEFKRYMRMFDGSESRCHTMDLRSLVGKERKPQERFKFKCSCQVHEVTKTLRNKMLRGSTRICKSCRGILTEVN
jgi:predicted SprT family Zn-dependent metalloprotease